MLPHSVAADAFAHLFCLGGWVGGWRRMNEESFWDIWMGG